MTLYFENGIESTPVRNDAVMTETAIYSIMVPLIKKILDNIGISENKVLITFSHDELDEEQYVFGDSNIDINITENARRSITICENCEFNLYFKSDIDKFTFDGYMAQIMH